MTKDRLTAFSDGVIAIIITVMVLELKVPREASLAGLVGVLPLFISYVLSFVYVAIYWNNHHHFFHLVRHVNGLVLWANMHLLFWLSLVPFATEWMGSSGFAKLPVAIYGVSLLMPALAWYGMQFALIRVEGRNSPLGQALGGDRKGMLSPLLYLLGIGSAFFDVRVGAGFYVLVALMWLVPDRRLERAAGEP